MNALIGNWSSTGRPGRKYWGSVRRLDRLEVARGLAALGIVFYHTFAIVLAPKYFGQIPFGRFPIVGSYGVDFFFVLSGFILFYVHQPDFGFAGELRRYLVKRLIRIYPPYWLVTALIVLIFQLVPPLAAGDPPSAAFVAKSMLLVPERTAPILAVGWSLRYEVLFYLIFGLLVWRPKAGAWIFWLWQASSVISTVTSVQWSPLMGHILDLRNTQFAMGMAAAYWVGRTGLKFAPIMTAAGGLIILITGLISTSGPEELPALTKIPILGLGSALMVAGLASLDLNASGRPPGILRLLGEASYSIYLVHYLLLSALAKLFIALGIQRWLPIEACFFALCGLATGGGILFHLAAERPLLRLCQRHLVPKRHTAEAGMKA